MRHIYENVPLFAKERETINTIRQVEITNSADLLRFVYANDWDIKATIMAIGWQNRWFLANNASLNQLVKRISNSLF
jgi:hypothetical protein